MTMVGLIPLCVCGAMSVPQRNKKIRSELNRAKKDTEEEDLENRCTEEQGGSQVSEKERKAPEQSELYLAPAPDNRALADITSMVR